MVASIAGRGHLLSLFSCFMKVIAQFTFLSVVLAVLPSLSHAQGYTVKALLRDDPGYLPSKLGGSGTLDIFGPGVLAADASGNIYVSSRDGIFRVDASGV